MRRVLLGTFLILLTACTAADGDPAATSSTVGESTSTTTAVAQESTTSSTTDPEPAETTTTEAPTTTTTTLPPLTGIAYEKVAGGFSFPVFVDSPDGDDRLFVVAKDGLIHIVKDGTVLVEPFLDVREPTRNSGEQGLLGLAFHPSYRSNGFFYVDYTDLDGNTVVARYQVSADPTVAEVYLGS